MSRTNWKPTVFFWRISFNLRGRQATFRCEMAKSKKNNSSTWFRAVCRVLGGVDHLPERSGLNDVMSVRPGVACERQA
jgi:hypothetical protein